MVRGLVSGEVELLRGTPKAHLLGEQLASDLAVLLLRARILTLHAEAGGLVDERHRIG